MRRSTLGVLAAGVGGAAVAGYGLSTGRSAWRSTGGSPNGRGMMLILAVAAAYVMMPFFGGRGLFRGHDKEPGEAFWLMTGYTLLIAAGWFIGFYVVLLFHTDARVPIPVAPIFWVTVGAIVFAGLGALTGLLQRPGRLQSFRIMALNDAFLANVGITETGGDDITHYDGDGNPLRFIEAHPNRLVFMVVGRRGKRAFIHLADSGEMVGYSGVEA